MCTIFAANEIVAKNYDSIADRGMIFTNKRGRIKSALVRPPLKPLEWVSVFGSITFSQLGKEFPVSGVNEAGLVVEQATLLQTSYPANREQKPSAGCLEAVQYLLDTCESVEKAILAMEQFEIEETSWPIHFFFYDRLRDAAVVEFSEGVKQVFRGNELPLKVLTNMPYMDFTCRRFESVANQLKHLPAVDTERAFQILSSAAWQSTVWSNLYDLDARKIDIKAKGEDRAIEIQMDQIDYSPQAADMMLEITKESKGLEPYDSEQNRKLTMSFYENTEICRLMKIDDPEKRISVIVNQAKKYDRTNGIVLRFLEGEKIKQIPVKQSHKYLVLTYLASKFEPWKEYTEAQVNAIIDQWHTFGDYFVLRRELVDSQLLKRLPNGSKYWRE